MNTGHETKYDYHSLDISFRVSFFLLYSIYLLVRNNSLDGYAWKALEQGIDGNHATYLLPTLRFSSTCTDTVNLLLEGMATRESLFRSRTLNPGTEEEGRSQ